MSPGGLKGEIRSEAPGERPEDSPGQGGGGMALAGALKVSGVHGVWPPVHCCLLGVRGTI